MSATGGAIVIGESWISEHYFTTDAKSQSFQEEVLKRRKAWDASAAEHHATARSRFTEARPVLETALAELGALLEAAEDGDRPLEGDALTRRAEDVHARLLDVLGLGESVAAGQGLRVKREGPLARVGAVGLDDAPLAIVHAVPTLAVEDLLAKDGATLAEPVALRDGDLELTAAARLVSALFVNDDPPALVLVLAGRWALLAERERWPEGRYLAVDVQLVCERNDARRGAEIDRALTCLEAASIAPDADGELWWKAVLEKSVKHTVGVSQDLREGVRLSIEIIANDVVRRRAAQGLPPLPGSEAQPLAKQGLRFLYRILFLLYAEASPELGVLPVGAPEYDRGYSLDRLRDLVQVELATPQGREGRHLYESLAVLFRLVDSGHAAPDSTGPDDAGPDAAHDGLVFNALRADLFRPEATAHIDAVGLGNAALQRVLSHLLLSKEKRGRDRGYISYAELGINQLGAVYEGLMSYTGFFAETDLYEVAKDGDSSKGSWVVPADRIEGIAENDFVRTLDEATGQLKPVLHTRGTFVFRLAGRERQQSASYYTPEVLTRFTVGQALEELLDQDGATTPAEEILGLSVCEPALGSGAFAIEAVRQLAEQYLRRRQAELGTTIDPDDYPRQLQRVKAYLALHNVYGVDLNATAVELAEISLWLDTMAEGLAAPWFGLHLRRGNSLIGARRAVYRRDQVEDRSFRTAVPRDVPMSGLAAAVRNEDVDGERRGGIHHFLLPADGWGSAADAKEAAALAKDRAKALKTWRSGVLAKPTKTQLDALEDLARRVEVLWGFAYRRLMVAEQQVRRAIPVWGAEGLAVGGQVTREQIEHALRDADGAYLRLRRIMDAWCALWFWPLTDELVTVEQADGDSSVVSPPSLQQWIDGLKALLGSSGKQPGRGRSGKDAAAGATTLAGALEWHELDDAEELERGFSGMRRVDDVLRDQPWLQVCERIAARQGFFHWELDFAPVFARGGFDLQLGNPPWVRPRSDVDALLAEGDPWWKLALKPSEEARAAKRAATLALPGMRDLVLDGTSDVACTAAFVGSVTQYPYLAGLQPDLYRCFMERTWRHGSVRGTIGLIHPETHFTDEKAGLLRSATYLRLRRHWQFVNELQLFEIDHHQPYGIHAYGSVRPNVRFINASSLYHPDTIGRSRDHDGSGAEPGLKDPDGRWDVRPHASRIITVTDETLRTWHEVLESSDVPVRQTRMVYAVNRSVASVLDKLAHAPRIGSLGLSFSAGWHETSDRMKGRFETRWGAPSTWDDVILQGPHLFVGTPLYKTPNRTMLHNQDWAATDFERLPPDAIPVTAYKPSGDRDTYDLAYTDWGTDDDPRPARDYYRLAWRAMAANTGERTLISALIPPGTAHINGVFCVGLLEQEPSMIAELAAFASSLVLDFSVRTTPKSGIYQGVFARLPIATNEYLAREIRTRSLRLNCVTDAYAELWRECYDDAFCGDSWTSGLPTVLPTVPLGEVGREWTKATPLRRAVDRRQAQVELDALVALSLSVTADELCTIYRTQFAVLYGYDHHDYVYDANGRLVPNSVLTVWRKKGEAMTLAERSATITDGFNPQGHTYVYEFPFRTLDREADMRRAHAEFERRLALRNGSGA